MEFPQDVWKEIMKFFPTHYRKTYHCQALMELELFEMRMKLKNNADTFYFYLITSSWVYWSVPDIQHMLVAPEINMNRNVAHIKIKDEFIKIWDDYAKKYPDYHMFITYIRCNHTCLVNEL